jgi:hypothetical protein
MASYKALSVALASIAATASGTATSHYSTVTTGSEGKAAPTGLKVFDGRGYFDFVQSQSNVPTLHRVTTAPAPYTTSISFTAPTGFTGANADAVDYISDFRVPNAAPPTLFAGWYTDAGVGTVAAYQGVKRTSLAQWSEVQTLSPPAQYDFDSFFGQSIAVDQSTHRKLAVGCPGCNSTANGGQVYLYSPTSPSATAWSQSQVLDISASGYNHLGGNVELHDNVLLASVDVPYHGASTKGYAAYVRGSKPEDPFVLQQILTINLGDVSSAAVYEETIILANQNQTIRSAGSAGAVYVLYPHADDAKLKPGAKPRPAQWSVQQVLMAPTPALNNHFGSSVSIDRDTMVVTEFQTDSAYIFKREEQSGKWSQQQVLEHTAPIVSSVSGSKLAIGGDSALQFANLEENWKCLVLSLEDQFGDGWDIAELVVTTPDGTHDYFSQSCELANPLQIRYCPNLASDGGLYSISVPGALKAKFYWELQWGVFDESTAKWHRGQWDTKMDFHWDPETLSFSSRKMDRVLPTNTTCKPCETRPTEKPTPVFRNLKGSSTKHPTVSPAPTVAVSTIGNWRYLNLETSTGNPWFNSRYQGTNYYVSDAHGHKLINTGTLCGDETSKQCWVDLPDGEYILRVSGALNTHKSHHMFSYCKALNMKGAQNQMTFRIENRDCSIVTVASQTAVCDSMGIPTGSTSVSLVLNVNVILFGASISQATDAERSVFTSAFASLFPGVTANDVTLVSVTPSGSSTFVSANIRMSSASGYNVLDIDEETALEAMFEETFANHNKETALAAAIGSGSVASRFSTVTRVSFVDFSLVDSVEVVASSSADVVSSFADEVTVSYTQEETTSSASPFLLESASVGYLLAGVGILFAVGFFVRSQLKDNSAATQLPTDSTHSNTGRRDLSKVAASLTPKDLNELARMEQEYLKIMVK